MNLKVERFLLCSARTQPWLLFALFHANASFNLKTNDELSHIYLGCIFIFISVWLAVYCLHFCDFVFYFSLEWRLRSDLFFTSAELLRCALLQNISTTLIEASQFLPIYAFPLKHFCFWCRKMMQVLQRGLINNGKVIVFLIAKTLVFSFILSLEYEFIFCFFFAMEILDCP